MYEIVNKDTIYGRPLEPTPDTVEYSISVTGLTVGRKSNASVFEPSPRGDRRDIIINYEPNEDVSVSIPTGCGQSAWARLAVNDRGTVTNRLCDSIMVTAFLDGYTVRNAFLVSEITSQFVRDTTITLDGRSYTAMRFDCRVTRQYYYQDSLRYTSTRDRCEFYYSPQIGALVRVETGPGVTVVDQGYFDTSLKLTGFTLKQ